MLDGPIFLLSGVMLPPFALKRDDRNRNTRENVSKISVNQSLKGFPPMLRAIDHESELAINKFYSASKTP